MVGMEKLEAIEQFDRVMQEMDRFLFVKHSFSDGCGERANRLSPSFAPR